MGRTWASAPVDRTPRGPKSKIAVGTYTVEQEFGMSTTPDSRPSIGAEPRIMYAWIALYPNVVR